jgi:chlorophyllide a reductase subunit Y
VPFNSETLVTGKLFEDIRDAVHELSRSGATTTRSSSPICVCRRLQRCAVAVAAEEINGVRIIGIDVPGFGVPTHAEAKDVLAGAMLQYARQEADGRSGASAARTAVADKPDRDAAGRDVPGRSGRASA